VLRLFLLSGALAAPAAASQVAAFNGGPQFVLNPSISFFVHVETAAEADDAHAGRHAGSV